MEEKLKIMFLEFGATMAHKSVQLSLDEYNTIQQIDPTASHFIIMKTTELSIP